MAPAEQELAKFKEYRITLLRERAKSPPTLEQFRCEFDALNAAIPLTDGCRHESINEAGVSGDRLTPRGSNGQRALLYHHGGGHTFGSPQSHRHLVARLAEAAGVVGFNMFYRLAPEHPYPAGLEDAVANYRWLLDQGFKPQDVIMSGESAGGNLTVALVLKLRELGLPQPGGLYLLSPWLDLEHKGRSHQQMAQADVVLNKALVEGCAAAYCAGGTSRADPLVSPLHADLRGLPPVLVQVGSSEILLSDSLDFAAAAALAGVDVTLRSWPDQVHGWPIFHPAMPVSATRAMAEAARWIGQCLAGQLG
jgi:monoterpene epsilon-lactone hydrolase